MKEKIQTVLIAFIALTSGTIAHAKYQLATSKSTVITPKAIHAGKASWYSEEDPGVNYRTANNEIFNDDAFTCAMWGVPFNQMIRVTNKANGRSIIVRVNDRGPHQRFVRRGRIVDLTKTAFEQIAPKHKGLIDVDVELL